MLTQLRGNCVHLRSTCNIVCIREIHLTNETGYYINIYLNLSHTRIASNSAICDWCTRTCLRSSNACITRIEMKVSRDLHVGIKWLLLLLCGYSRYQRSATVPGHSQQKPATAYRACVMRASRAFSVNNAVSTTTVA